MFLISILAPSSGAPTGRTETLTSQRTMPFSMSQSLTPPYIEDVLEGVEVFVGHVGASEVGLGNDFQQRHARAVEIHAAVAVEVRALAHVLLEVRAGDAHAREGRR